MRSLQSHRVEPLINKVSIAENIDLLIVKTGFSEKRNTNEYWEFSYGFNLGVASLLRKRFPNIRVLAFDMISLSSFQQREIGRKSHIEFLVENNILIVEDVDLSEIDQDTKIEQVILAPLRFENAEGAPLIILAKIEL